MAQHAPKNSLKSTCCIELGAIFFKNAREKTFGGNLNCNATKY